MKGLGITAALALAAFSSAVTAADVKLNETQTLGRRLVETHCGICHTRPTLLAGLYGPELSSETAGGNEEVVRGIVANGTPRMPGFKYMFNDKEIAAIAAYLKVLPPGHQKMTVPPK